MTYDSFETSADSGQPIECFEITAGAQVFRYTSAPDSQTIGANTYTPKAISRETRVDGPDNRKRDFRFRLPTTDAVSQLYVGDLPGIRTRVKLFRFHRNDTPTPEVVQEFDGFVNGVSWEDANKTTVFTCRVALATAVRQVPPRTYQKPCNHVLYESNTCKVDDTDPAFQASGVSVSGQSGSVLTVVGLGAYASGWFTGGYVEVVGSNEYRMILNDDGAGNLTLLVPFANAPTTVNVYAGCDHSIATCKTKFDNVVNYGGFAFVPTKNPYEGEIV